MYFGLVTIHDTWALRYEGLDPLIPKLGCGLDLKFKAVRVQWPRMSLGVNGIAWNVNLFLSKAPLTKFELVLKPLPAYELKYLAVQTLRLIFSWRRKTPQPKMFCFLLIKTLPPFSWPRSLSTDLEFSDYFPAISPISINFWLFS